MALQTIYKATHDVTNEVIEGNGKELAAVMGVVPSTVSKMATWGRKIAKHWTVKKIGQADAEPLHDYKFPYELLKEWDEVTEPFKAASRRGLINNKQMGE